MPGKKKIDKRGLRNLKNLSHECNEDNEVTLVYCRTCPKYYLSGNCNDSPRSRDKYISMLPV